MRNLLLTLCYDGSAYHGWQVQRNAVSVQQVFQQALEKEKTALAECSKEQEEAVAQYALALGNAFQIADDILDYTGVAADIGKNLGADLREGKMTLPLIYTRELTTHEGRALIDEAVRKGDGPFDKITKLVVDCGALDRCSLRAEAELERGRQALAKLPPSIFNESLLELLSFTVRRDR